MRRSTAAVSGLALGVGLVGTAYASVVSSHLLHPAASPQGCRVVVLQESFFLLSGGAVYVLHGETGVVRRAWEFQTDDGERPFSSGAAELQWYGEEAVATGPLWVLPGEELAVQC